MVFLYLMGTAEKIVNKIESMIEGTTFSYRELPIATCEYSAATKAIERLLKRGIINRASTGLFYKPKQTAFGKLRPSEEDLLKPYLFKNGKRVAYITGIALYNKLGLTTQIPKDIRVASRDRRIITKVGNIKVKAVKSYSDVNDENYYLMELLDVLKDFKIIPDTDKIQVIRFMLQKFKKLTVKEKNTILEIVFNYPPRVRAFTGALFNELNPDSPEMKLKESINPLSIFEFGLDKAFLKFIDFWNIR